MVKVIRIAKHKFPTDSEESPVVEGQEEPTLNTDMALAKAIDFMNSKKDIEIKTDIPSKAVPFIVAIQEEEKYTESSVMSHFVKEFKILRVSTDRKSRLEVIELAKNRREENQGNSSLFGRALGWLKGGNNYG